MSGGLDQDPQAQALQKSKQSDAPVLPLVTPEQAAEQWARFESLKAKLLTEEDYQTIAGKRYIKRSGFRKIAVYFGISDRIIREERRDLEDGSFIWRVVVEAIAPNGRTCIGVGACDSRERGFAHIEHDVYSTSHTRAKSRSISDMIAGGSILAEEMEAEQATTTTPKTLEQKREQSIQGWEIRTPITKEVLADSSKQFPLIQGTVKVGMMNVLDDMTETSIVPERQISKDDSTIANFLVPRVMEPMVTKHAGIEYQLMCDRKGMLRAIILRGPLDEQLIKDLVNATRWAFSRAME